MIDIEISVYGIAAYEYMLSVCTNINMTSTFAIADYQCLWHYSILPNPFHMPGLPDLVHTQPTNFPGVG
jgi:hypothetical protein